MKIFRGVNKIQDEQESGEIRSKGMYKEVVPKLDGEFKLDGTFVLGASVENTARAQQIKTNLYGASAISASKDEEVAIYFATFKNREDGYVYVIDINVLNFMMIRFKEFSDPVFPREKEVTIILNPGEMLPKSAIIEKYEVSANGMRKYN